MSTSPAGYNRIQPLSPVERELFFSLMGTAEDTLQDSDAFLMVRNQSTVLPAPYRVAYSDLETLFTAAAADSILDGEADLEAAVNALFYTNRWDDLRISATSLNTGGANAPNFGKVLDNGAGSQGVNAQLFDAAAEEELYFEVQIPHRWLTGTDLLFHVHWMPTTTDAGDVVWGLEYTWANIGEVFGDTTIITATAAAGGTAWFHHMTNFAAIDATDKEDSSMLLCRIFRDATNLADDYAADAALLEVDFHFLVGKPGEIYIPSP